MLKKERAQVFLADFSKETDTPNWKNVLIQQRIACKEKLLGIARQHTASLVALRTRRFHNSLLSRKIQLLSYQCIGAMVNADPEVIRLQDELEEVYRAFNYEQELKKLISAIEFRTLLDTYHFAESGFDDTTVEYILRKEKNVHIRKMVWRLMGLRGQQCVGLRIQLVNAQNKALQQLAVQYKLPFRNYHEFVFKSQEFDRKSYKGFMQRIEHGTRNITRKVLHYAKERLGSPCMPWDVYRVDRDIVDEAEAYYKKKNVMEILEKTFAEWGFNIQKITYHREERKGKLAKKLSHPGVCIPEDPLKGVIYILSSPGNSIVAWYVNLHESGHGNHALHIDVALGPIVSDSNVAIQETTARFSENMAFDPEWMMKYLGMPEDTVVRFLMARRVQELLKFRGVRHYVAIQDFDRVLYELVDMYYRSPQKYKEKYGDKKLENLLTEIYWKQCIRYIGGKAWAEQYKELIKYPQWAGLYHFLFTAAYMPIGYIKASALDAQNKKYLKKILKRNSLLNNPEIGQWLQARYYQQGNLQSFHRTVKQAVGKDIDPSAYLELLNKTEKQLKEEVRQAKTRLEADARSGDSITVPENPLPPRPLSMDSSCRAITTLGDGCGRAV